MKRKNKIWLFVVLPISLIIIVLVVGIGALLIKDSHPEFSEDGIVYLVIQPDETFTEAELLQIVKEIYLHPDLFIEHASQSIEISPDSTIEKPVTYAPPIVMKPIHFPKESHETPQRIRADSILHRFGRIAIEDNLDKVWFMTSFDEGTGKLEHSHTELPDSCHSSTFSTIYLTKNDICCTKGDKANWGVLGLSFRGKRICIVSTHRLKHRKDLVKLIAHEDNHAMGMPHCKNDDKSCIMKDAKGHPDLEHETHICDRCRKEYEEEYRSDLY